MAFPGLGTICFTKDLTNAFVIASPLSIVTFVRLREAGLPHAVSAE